MVEVIKSLGKRKVIYILIMLQFSFSILYFFITSAAIQSAFYVNINVPRELDISTEQIIHMEVDAFADREGFESLVSDIEKMLNGKVGAYDTYVLYDGKLGGEVETIEIDKDINLIKDIVVAEGSYFDEEDFEYDKMQMTEENRIPILVGSELAEEYKLEIGSVVCDEYNCGFYVVKGILESGSKWFYGAVPEGTILDLGNQIIIPKSQSDMYIPLHYYWVLPESIDKENIINQIEQLVDKNNVVVDSKFLSDELSERFEATLQENEYWMIFAVIMLIMISIGTATLFAAQMNSRKHDIGIRIAVGYSYGRIARLLIGEVLVVVSVSFFVAIIVGKIILGSVTQETVIGKGIYTNGYYISLEIILLGAIVMLMMCIPAIVSLGTRVRRLQPKELIGGKE